MEVDVTAGRHTCWNTKVDPQFLPVPTGPVWRSARSSACDSQGLRD